MTCANCIYISIDRARYGTGKGKCLRHSISDCNVTVMMELRKACELFYPKPVEEESEKS